MTNILNKIIAQTDKMSRRPDQDRKREPTRTREHKKYKVCAINRYQVSNQQRSIYIYVRNERGEAEE